VKRECSEFIGPRIFRTRDSSGPRWDPVARWGRCEFWEDSPSVIKAPGMSDTLKVREIGNSLGVILPTSTLEDLDVEDGDELFAIQTPDGGQLTPYDPEFAEAMEDAREFMRPHRNAFRELA